MINVFFFIFFFSSRRRHTRSYGDWSSDVCSSDLRIVALGGIAPASFEDFIKLSSIKKGNSSLKPEEMVTELYNDHMQVINEDRKSTRLNSSHRTISYAVFCLKKKKKKNKIK